MLAFHRCIIYRRFTLAKICSLHRIYITENKNNIYVFNDAFSTFLLMDISVSLIFESNKDRSENDCISASKNEQDAAL